MKQTLRLRGELCPKTEPFINLLYTIYITFTIVLVSCVCTRAQVSAFSQEAGPAAEAVSEIKPLKIGDTIPEELWNAPLQVVNHPEGKEFITLHDYKGKLIVIDFWATWCAACIHSLDKLDTLKNRFQNDLVILPSSYEDGNKVVPFIKKRGWTLASLKEDTVLKAYFPHRLIPHCVIIGTRGKILAITSSDNITSGNISGLLNKKAPEMKKKMDINTDLPLFASPQFPVDESTFYSVLVKGSVVGLPTGNYYRKMDNTIRGRALTNSPIQRLYAICVRAQIQDLNEKRIIIDVRDISKVDYRLEYGDRNVWDNENAYSIDMIVPVSDADSLYHYMLECLNRYSGYYGRVESRKIRYLALKTTRTKDRPLAKGDGVYLNKLSEDEKRLELSHTPISALTSRLNNALKPLVIDETGIKDKINIVLKNGLADLPTLREELQRYGLDLIERTKDLDMLVIKDKPL